MLNMTFLVPFLAALSVFLLILWGHNSMRSSFCDGDKEPSFERVSLSLSYPFSHTSTGQTSTHRKANKIPPSLLHWDTVEKPDKFSLSSMIVDHSSSGNWYVPSLHDKFSAGWNRTANKGFSSSSISCNIRFVGIALESTLKGYIRGGTGYITMKANRLSRGVDNNATNRAHCYYMTNKDYGSEFHTTPRSLGLAVICPISLDKEIGEFEFRGLMVPGYYCRLLADMSVTIDIHLHPSNYKAALDTNLDVNLHIEHSLKETAERSKKISIEHLLESPPRNSAEDEREITGRVVTSPDGHRKEIIKEMMRDIDRPHAVCTVQTFKNQQTGPMMYLFVTHYHSLGWSVIIYDRFGMHEEYLRELSQLPGVFYHPYTVYQLSEPTKFNAEYAKQQGEGYKVYYDVEMNWGFGGAKVKETADHDADKTRTYDHAKMEYHYFDVILYVDGDEFFYCPQSGGRDVISTTANSASSQSSQNVSYSITDSFTFPFASYFFSSSSSSSTPSRRSSESPPPSPPLAVPSNLEVQRQFQQSIISEFHFKGIEEMRFVRIPYSGRAPSDFRDSRAARSSTDFTNHTQRCMVAAYRRQNISEMFACWSTASSFDNFPKSADFAGVCPFHYNHWSCEGMKYGGRDPGKNIPRCRCKVSFDMQNGFPFRPILDKCHLLHLNNNKYRYQSRREKHQFDYGNVTVRSPLADLYNVRNPKERVQELRKSRG